MTNRSAFEAAISAPPYLRDITRWPDDHKKYGWPGGYRDINVALAWCMWQEATRLEREALSADVRLLAGSLRALLDDTQHAEHPSCEDGPCPVRDAREALAAIRSRGAESLEQPKDAHE